MTEPTGQQTAGQTGQTGQAGQYSTAPQTAPGLPPSIWDNLPESENYIKFTPENNFTARIRFIDNEPRQVPSTFTKDKTDYEFEVIDLTTPEPVVKIWSISSVRLMRTLKEHTPLDGKAFQAIRTGEGMKIDYILTPIV